MSETIQVENTADLICHLKAAVTALECQYKINQLEEQAHKKEKKPRQPPMFVMIPLEKKRNGDDSTARQGKTRHRGKNRHGPATINQTDSVRTHCGKSSARRHDECDETNGPRMRGGVLHGRCGCIHRDGLQDSCPLTECQGQPACMTKPWATCQPARYFRARFPDNWPSATDSITF